MAQQRAVFLMWRHLIFLFYTMGDKRPMSYIKDKLICFLKDALWYYTVAIILLKSIIFLGFIVNSDHSKSDLILGYYNVPSILLYSCFIIALAAFSFLFKGRTHMWFLIGLNLFVSFLLMVDLWYYRGFGTLISIHLLKQSANLDSTSGSIFSMLRAIDFIFVFDALILPFIALKIKNLYRKTGRNVIAFALLFAFSVSYISYAHYRDDIIGQGQKQIVFRICWSPNQTISNLSPVGYHIYDTYVYWKDRKQITLKPEEKDEIKKWFENKKENLPDNNYKALLKGKNLIFIQVESLESFVINRKINDQEITPNLNRLMANSLYFPRIYEQVNEGTSSDSDLMSNTSIYPVRRGSTFFRYPENSYNSLPKILQKHGYSTTAIHPDKGSFWNWMPALKSIGFEKCIEGSYFNRDEIIGLGISDGSYLRQIATIVNDQKPPFYTFMVTLTSHGPFDIPKKYRKLNLDVKLDETKLGGYFQSLHYTDEQIGMFISKLKESGTLENSVLVIYGDHCGVHKYYQDELKMIQPAEDWWLEQNKCIPLFVYNPGLHGEEIKSIGGQIDIFPTVCYLMGVEEEEYVNTAMGKNLLKTKKNFAVLSDGTYVGEAENEEDRAEAIKGLDIADKIIQSNYFYGR